jgi:hypothetical protein
LRSLTASKGLLRNSALASTWDSLASTDVVSVAAAMAVVLKRL